MLGAEVEGLSIVYERAGSGPGLFLLHGFLFDSRAWRPQLESLSSDFTVIAWDAPGAGRSSDPPETFATADWAGCLGGLLDIEGIRAAHILGLSWGGMVAQEFYRRHPQRTRSRVLADTYAGWRGSLGEATAEERLANCLRDSSLPAGEVVGKYLPGMHSDSATQEVRDALASIMSGFHAVGFRLMALSSAQLDTRYLRNDHFRVGSSACIARICSTKSGLPSATAKMVAPRARSAIPRAPRAVASPGAHSVALAHLLAHRK